jgi:hypothetical protein
MTVIGPSSDGRRSRHERTARIHPVDGLQRERRVWRDVAIIVVIIIVVVVYK